MRKALPNILTGVLASLLVCFLASCDLTGPQGEPGKDGEDAIGYTAQAVNTAVKAKTRNSVEEPWTVKVRGVDISDPSVYRQIINGITSAIQEGDIALDLSDCTGKTFVYTDGINRAEKLRIVAITLPESLTHLVDGPAVSDAGQVGAGAFHGYTRLGSVKAPGLTYIGDYAFYSPGNAYDDETHSSNVALTEVNFPKVRSVGAYAFAYCTELRSVNLPQAVSIGDFAFAGDQSYTSLTEVYLPAALSIGVSAFEKWRTIRSITLSEVTTIGASAFAGPPVSNAVLDTLSLPKVKTIGASAFANYSKLATIDLPVVETIGNSAFGCSLETINDALETLDLSTVTSIGTLAFRNCTALSSLTLGPNIPTAPTTSTAERNGIFFLANGIAGLEDAIQGTITISVPEDKKDAYETAGWKASAQGDNTTTGTIKFGTNHKAITISTYTEEE